MKKRTGKELMLNIQEDLGRIRISQRSESAPVMTLLRNLIKRKRQDEVVMQKAQEEKESILCKLFSKLEEMKPDNKRKPAYEYLKFEPIQENQVGCTFK